MILETKKGNDDRLLLDGSIRGRAQPGRMLAVMGPSGSGKSTLIHALAGKIKDSPKLSLFGHRYINGEELSPDSAVPAAFIEQEVNFFPHMTVKETLDFRVELKLGKKLRKSERNKVVEDLMDTLGLSKSSNTKVGNTKIRGLSGGERKRLSIACEMISSPSIIFLDEVRTIVLMRLYLLFLVNGSPTKLIFALSCAANIWIGFLPSSSSRFDTPQSCQ